MCPVEQNPSTGEGNQQVKISKRPFMILSSKTTRALLPPSEKVVGSIPSHNVSVLALRVCETISPPWTAACDLDTSVHISLGLVWTVYFTSDVGILSTSERSQPFCDATGLKGLVPGM